MDSNLESSLKKSLKHWKKKLNLEDWEIVLKVCNQSGMDVEDNQGLVIYKFTGKQAIIKILDPNDWDNDDFEQNIEKTLIHELLHLRFEACTPKDETADKMQHQLLDDIAKLLSNLDPIM